MAATESVADLKRQLEFGNASVQARAFTAVVGLIANSKSESAKAERTLAVEQLWNCLKCDRVSVVGWSSTAIVTLVGQNVLLKGDAIRQCILALGPARHPRIVIETIGKLLIGPDKIPISNPTHPFLTVVYQHPNTTQTLISYFDAELRTQNKERQSAIIPLVVRLAIGHELGTTEKNNLYEVIERSSTDATDHLINVWLWSGRATHCVLLPLLARNISRADHLSILLDAQCALEQFDFSSITDEVTFNSIDSLALSKALSMAPIDQTIRLLALPSLQRIVKERRHGALFLPTLLQMYSVANDLTSVGLLKADDMKTLKQSIATAGSSDEPLPVNDDERCITETRSLMLQLHLLTSSTDSTRSGIEWLRYWLSTGVPHASTTSVDVIAFLMSICKDVSSTTLCCQLLAKFASVDPALSNYIFPLVLQQYSKASDPVVKSALLAIIPKLSTHRLCTPPIFKFLLAMCQQPNTRIEAIGLLGKLWERHERLFSQFQEWLTKSNTGDRCDWAYAKVQLMRKICRQAGDDYGEELLPVLSGIINQPPNPDNEQIAAEAVMAISDLCRLEVIELPATWKQLWSKLRKDDRTAVQIALCHLLSIASNETEEAPDETFLLFAINQLWQLASTANDSIKSAVFEALAKFDCRLFTLKVLPDVARARVKLPASKIAEGGSEDPAEVLNYIPGFCFVDLLDSLAQPARLGFKTLLKTLIRTEVTDFGRSIYHVKPVVSLQKSSSPLRDVESRLTKLYVDGKQDDINGTLAVACLYIDLVESSAQSTESNKRQAFVAGRKYLDIFSKLLSDIRLDPNDWRRCISILSGWHCFMRNMFEALISSRYAELEMDPAKRSADSLKRISSAWLWARDQIVEKMKRAVAESTPAQLNTTLALASLVAVVQQHKKTMVEETANEGGPYVAHNQWLISALEMLLSNAWPEYKVKARLLLTEGTLATPTAMMSSFASVSACCVMPLIMDEVRSFLGPVDDLFLAYLRRRATGDLSTVEALCLPFALGLIDPDSDRFTDSVTTTSTIGRALGAIAHFARRCDAPPAGLIEKFETETMLNATEKGSVDIAIYYHLTNYVGASTVVAQEHLEAIKREKASRQDELKKALEPLKAAPLPAEPQTITIRSVFRLLHTVDGTARTDGEKQLAAFVTRLISGEDKDKDALLISAIVDGMADFVAVESVNSVEKRLPQSYSNLPESSVLCAVVDRLLQPELTEDMVELLIECMLGKFRQDGRSLPPLDWHQLVGRWTQHERLQPLLIQLAVQEQSVALACNLMSQERLNVMTADTVQVLAAHLASSVAFIPTAHLNRAFKQCFELACSVGDSAMLNHLWTAIKTGLSLTVDKASATSNKTTRQLAFDWLDTWIAALPAIDSEAVTALPIFVCFGDLGACLDEWDLKKILKRLEYDSVSKCMWLHCHLLRTGHWQLCSARSSVELLITMSVEQRCTAFLMLMESARVAGVKLFDWSKRNDWLLDMMNDSLALLRGSTDVDAVDSSMEQLCRAPLYFSVLTAMVAGWAPTTVPHGLLRGDGDQKAASIDEKMWTIVRRRFPVLLASLLVDSEFDAVASKLTEWAIDLFIGIKPTKSGQLTNIEACLRTLLSHNPASVTLFDRKGIWDELLFFTSPIA